MGQSVLKKVIQGGAKVAEKAAPIVTGAIGAVVGGPAGAAAGATIGKGISTGIKKVASARALGGAGGFTPSTAGSLGQARGQDKSRMKQQYGMGGADNS